MLKLHIIIGSIRKSQTVFHILMTDDERLAEFANVTVVWWSSSRLVIRRSFVGLR